MIEKITINIVTELDIVAARQQGRDEAREIGFSTVDQARIATVISELARNIYLYAHVGSIIIERIEDDGAKGIAITSIDNGPGIKNVQQVMEEGYSTSGGIGAGLPGVRRLMDTMEIQSEEDKGTTIRVTKLVKM